MSKNDIRQIEIRIIKRSQISFAPYNPKVHTDAAIKQQLKNLKRVGYLGGIVWNETTGNIVSGHKRVMAFDLHYKYDGTPEKDYDLSVGVAQMDEKTEKEQNIYMDAQGTNTHQDFDLLAELIPDIDYKSAGLTEEDLQLIGVDYLLQTDDEKAITAAFDELMSPVNELREAEKAAKKELTEQEKIEHNKKVKEEVRQSAQEKAENMESYVMISFDTYKAKSAFMQRFGFDPMEKFIKGELFENMVERIE